MAQLTIEISGVPLDESQHEELRTRLHEAASAILTPRMRPDIDILLGHKPMLMGGELTEEEHEHLARAVVGTIMEITGYPIDPRDRGRISFRFTPDSEQEHLLQEILALRNQWQERNYALTRNPDSADSIQQELDALESRILALESRLVPPQN